MNGETIRRHEALDWTATVLSVKRLMPNLNGEHAYDIIAKIQGTASFSTDDVKPLMLEWGQYLLARTAEHLNTGIKESYHDFMAAANFNLGLRLVAVFEDGAKVVLESHNCRSTHVNPYYLGGIQALGYNWEIRGVLFSAKPYQYE
ncbi:hypothetical protein [Cohnella fermenti]|uniref:Uncharacterized protein n=1 Tax=Cohnella fermenti TaxID=2565925 RepID=A0A4S4BKR6_9BACL|nr:hypothetical protein [Cohnella fermenti]THF75231.1 hypothetical protein E6C55_22445 [Cohnella fermenti]